MQTTYSGRGYGDGGNVSASDGSSNGSGYGDGSAPSSPITRLPDGTATWVVQPGDKYVVTGVTRDGRRFRQTCGTWFQARCVNLWRGSKWLLRDGRRYLLSRTWN